MEGQNFPAVFCASTQDALEYALLCFEAPVVTRTSVKSDFANVASFRQKLLEKRDLVFPLGDELGMEPKCDANVGRALRHLSVACPCLWRGGDSECGNALAITLRDQLRVVGI